MERSSRVRSAIRAFYCLSVKPALKSTVGFTMLYASCKKLSIFSRSYSRFKIGCTPLPFKQVLKSGVISAILASSLIPFRNAVACKVLV